MPAAEASPVWDLPTVVELARPPMENAVLSVLPNSSALAAGSVPVRIQKLGGRSPANIVDVLAVEEPLEIRLGFSTAGVRFTRTISITMRTPGNDLELAAGFLLTEGIIASAADLDPMGRSQPAATACNVVCVDLRPEVAVDLPRLERHVYTSSSCGVCGKTSLNAVRTRLPRLPDSAVTVAADTIHRLPERLSAVQSVFDQTGGLHAAGLFDLEGNLLSVREDVGRHNAVDKLIGAQLLADRLPLSHAVLFLSGRASFELVQKALAAGIPVVAAVGAPSSLAVELAREAGMTLLGFVRDRRFNIYAGAHRVHPLLPPVPPDGQSGKAAFFLL